MRKPDGPIFVVGVPRSGTTLLAAILAAHSRLSCGPETHFFSKGYCHRFTTRRIARSWPDGAVAELFTIANFNGILPEVFGLSREEIASYLRSRPPSAQMVLSALTESFALKMGKNRWVEKTPRHLLHLPEIQQCFPGAAVIRIVRDPRDTALSILKAPWRFHNFLESLLYWQYLDARSAPLYAANPHVYTVRYEDLLLHPERELRQICSFVGEDFEPGMLDTSESAQQVNPTRDSWKLKVGGPLDATRINVWQRSLSEAQKQQAEAIVGDRLRAFGYLSECRFDRYVAAFPMHALACYPDLVAGAVARRIRFWPASKEERPEVKLYVGHPESDGWLGHSRRMRFTQTLSIAADVLRTRFKGQPFRWVNTTNAYHSFGYCSRLISLVLGRGQRDVETWPLGTRQPINAWL
jgi:hypothetical protein